SLIIDRRKIRSKFSMSDPPLSYLRNKRAPLRNVQLNRMPITPRTSPPDPEGSGFARRICEAAAGRSFCRRRICKRSECEMSGLSCAGAVDFRIAKGGAVLRIGHSSEGYDRCETQCSSGGLLIQNKKEKV